MNAQQQQERSNGHHSEREDRLSQHMDILAAVNQSDQPRSLESEQLQIQVVTAKRFPRSVKDFLVEAESMATINHEMAQSCFYSVPRSGKTVSGPSIRLAEICMSAWGHLDAGTRVKEIAATYIVVEGFAWDMQTNIKVRQEVRRNIMTSAKNGQQPRRYSEDMIANTVNAGASIALRNAILRVIPRAYVEQLWEKARKVAIGDAKTLSATRETAVSYFLKIPGLTAERIFAALGVKGIEDITIDEVGILKGYATAIKDGETTVDECFPPLETKTAKADEKLRDEPAKAKQDESPAPPPKAEESKPAEPKKGKAAKAEPPKKTDDGPTPDALIDEIEADLAQLNLSAKDMLAGLKDSLGNPMTSLVQLSLAQAKDVLAKLAALKAEQAAGDEAEGQA